MDFEHVFVELARAEWERGREFVVAAKTIIGLDLKIMFSDIEIETDSRPSKRIAYEWVKCLISHGEFRVWGE